ncbi:hypothetical protein PIIN_11414 [Serendipita indica DSM 11827]|uniref:Uncharacterized protein n=1 Tax=Serendipita indica (strain DSM 11827) TaxID=1109443 RepID=G4U1J4_SERID|nr:hypothetical protein PIIN_11414 [Serendipita indica DSM 11827]
MAFAVPIQDSAPHIYITALPFSPLKSLLLKEGLKKHIYSVMVTRGAEETFPVLPRTLLGHQGVVRAVSFSPDGTRIISGSSDNTIRQWDAETGQPVGEPLRGHVSSVNAVEFSPDGKQVVSGSIDMRIQIWSSDNGNYKTAHVSQVVSSLFPLIWRLLFAAQWMSAVFWSIPLLGTT